MGPKKKFVKTVAIAFSGHNTYSGKISHGANFEVLANCKKMGGTSYHNIIDRKFGGEFNLAVWRIGQPTAKLKSANIKSLLCTFYTARART